MKPWHYRVFTLREAGFSVRHIARELGKDSSMVRWVLDENGERERARNRIRASRAGITGTDDAGFIKRHVPRVIPKPVDTLSIARRFAAGEITREQLSRELRGQA